MKRIAILTLFLLSLLPVRAAEKSPFNLKGYDRCLQAIFETAKDTAALNDMTTAENILLKFKKYFETLDGQIFQVLFDEDNTSFCLAQIYIDGDKYDTRTAAIFFYDEIVYDKKSFKKEELFLAGTYTYETKGNEVKTVPLYFTGDYFLNRLLNDILLRTGEIKGEETDK